MLIFIVFYVVTFALIEAIPTYGGSYEQMTETGSLQVNRGAQIRGGVDGYQTYGGYRAFSGYQAYGGYRNGNDQQGGTYQREDDYQDNDEYQSRRGYGGRYASRGVYQIRGRGAGRFQHDDDNGDMGSEESQYTPRSCRGCSVNNIGNGQRNRNEVYMYD